MPARVPVAAADGAAQKKTSAPKSKENGSAIPKKKDHSVKKDKMKKDKKLLVKSLVAQKPKHVGKGSSSSKSLLNDARRKVEAAAKAAAAAKKAERDAIAATFAAKKAASREMVSAAKAKAVAKAARASAATKAASAAVAAAAKHQQSQRGAAHKDDKADEPEKYQMDPQVRAQLERVRSERYAKAVEERNEKMIADVHRDRSDTASATGATARMNALYLRKAAEILAEKHGEEFNKVAGRLKMAFNPGMIGQFRSNLILLLGERARDNAVRRQAARSHPAHHHVHHVSLKEQDVLEAAKSIALDSTFLPAFRHTLESHGLIDPEEEFDFLRSQRQRIQRAAAGGADHDEDDEDDAEDGGAEEDDDDDEGHDDDEDDDDDDEDDDEEHGADEDKAEDDDDDDDDDGMEQEDEKAKKAAAAAAKAVGRGSVATKAVKKPIQSPGAAAAAAKKDTEKAAPASAGQKRPRSDSDAEKPRRRPAATGKSSGGGGKASAPTSPAPNPQKATEEDFGENFLEGLIGPIDKGKDDDDNSMIGGADNEAF